MAASPPPNSTHSEIWEQYNRATWSLEAGLKQFLSQWHGEATSKKLSKNPFKPQEFNLEIDDRDYDDLVADGAADVNNEPITSFNRDFLSLFKNVLMVPSGPANNKYQPNGDLLWGGILEVEAIAEAAQSIEPVNYSLVCFNKKIPASAGFFAAHRKYAQLREEVFGLTDLFLAPGVATDLKERFRPVFISLTEDRHDQNGQNLPTNSDDTLLQSPYEASRGFHLKPAVVRKIDDKLRTLQIAELVHRPDKDAFVAALDSIYEETLEGRLEDLISTDPAAGKPSELWQRVEEKRKEFARYLIWLRTLGIAGGSENNWTDYFYFCVPDLSGYLHAVTISTANPINKALFHLIDRNATTLFHRSLLRLAVREIDSRIEIESHARRAAVAAIMSRNMSHNIGSHVTPRASLDLVRARLESVGGDIPKQSKSFKVLNNLKYRLDEYIQKKADFLAEITTEPLATTKSALFYREVIAPFVQNSLLMDNIAANEKINFNDSALSKNCLKIRVFSNGKELKGDFSCQHKSPNLYNYPDELPYSLTCAEHSQELVLQHVENGEHEVEVELPGPLGEFAFFGVLENYIRNAAKHNKKAFEREQVLGIRIDISEPADAKERLHYYELRISDNLSKGEKLTNQIKEYLKADIVEKKDGRLKREAWGIAEMKICATLLRGSSAFNDMSDNLRVETGSNDSVGLIMRLMKPKKACIVKPEVNQETTEALQKCGVWVFSKLEDLYEYLSHTTEESETDVHPISSFRFAVFDYSSKSPTVDELKRITDLLPHLPFRVLLTVSNENAELIASTLGKEFALTTTDKIDIPADEDPAMAANAIVEWCWRHWVQERFIKRVNKDGMAQLHVYLEQAAKEEPTATWINRAQRFNEASGALTLAVWDSRPSCNTNISPSGEHLLYDRHGGILRARNTFRKAIFKIRDFSSDNYYNYLDKLSSDFTLIYSPQFPAEDFTAWSLPWEIAEAALLKIIIVDERVAERAFDKLEDKDIGFIRDRLISKFSELKGTQGLARFYLAWASRVYICTDRAVLSAEGESLVQPLHKSLKEIASRPKTVLALGGPETSVTHYPATNSNEGEPIQAEMLVIHQGILDDIVKESLSTNDSSGEELEARKKEMARQLLSGLRQKFPFVIVDSGRGRPHTLPEKEKFLPFSLVQDYLLGQRVSKYSMARVAMSLTRRRTRADE